MPSSIPGAPHKLRPVFPASSSPGPRNPHDEKAEHESTRSIIASRSLQRHIEGGYFAEIDRNPLVIPNPFLHQRQGHGGDGDVEEGGHWEGLKTAEKPVSGDQGIRTASTSIYYLLTPVEPQGCFHRNKGRTVCFLFFFFLFLHSYLIHSSFPTQLFFFFFFFALSVSALDVRGTLAGLEYGNNNYNNYNYNHDDDNNTNDNNRRQYN